MCKEEEELKELYDDLEHRKRVIEYYNEEIIRILDYMKQLQSEGKEKTPEFKELEKKALYYMRTRDTNV